DRGGHAVLRRAEPAHELVATIDDPAQEGAPAEVGRAVVAARLLQKPRAPLLGRGRSLLHEGQLLERTRDPPLDVELVEAVPAEERSVTGVARAPARAGVPRIEEGAAQAPALQPRVTRARLLLPEPREVEERGRQIEVRSHRLAPRALRPAR